MTDIDLTELFAAPPPEFVTTRNALAKSLRVQKRREEAAAVAAIRRPSWVDWALNAAASTHGDAARWYADAAAQLRDAQAASIEGRDGPDLRTSLRELRDATAAFAKHASAALVGADRAPDAGDIAARLGEVAADPATVDQLLAGVLGSSETDGPDLFAGLTPAMRPASKKAAPASKPTTRKRAAVDERDDAEATAAARAAAQRAALESALAEAERDQAVAGAEVADADEVVREAEEVEARARAALDEAQQAAKAARARRRDATKALAGLDKAVDAARAALAG